MSCPKTKLMENLSSAAEQALSYTPSMLTGAQPRPAEVKALARQHTLAKEVSCVGVGVHSGAPAKLTLRPAPVDSGITFIRTDLSAEQGKIPARWDKVYDTRLCTALQNDVGGKISTTEHLMAALVGSGVDNVEVLIDGPEVPIMDGSSADFIDLIKSAGVDAQPAKRRVIRVLRQVEVRDGDKLVRLTPAAETSYSMDIAFDSRAIGAQSRSFTLKQGSFAQELSGARTFGFLHEVEQLRAMGLARGGSLDNAVVIDGDTIMNEGGLRYTDEFVRHKLLDAVGDLALAGHPLQAAYYGVKGGHALNNQLLRALFADAANWEWA